MIFTTQHMPYATAEIAGKGTSLLTGKVLFYEVGGGTCVYAEVRHLPSEGTFFGFHIHSGESCASGKEGSHYNPSNQPHPKHVGDLPPLLGNHGTAVSSFYTDRFYPEDIVGKVVVIHEMPDDFRTQPSGDAGTIIGCGKILENHG